jgi:aspartyl-tRNA(Asn)/glutamyl-tRNA(Gln) amidotransferase subunit C
MNISKEEVAHVARLARLEVDEEALEQLSGQIGEILDYMDQLKQVETGGVEPTSHAIALTNAFREDVERGSVDVETALANAPEKEEGSFVVPKVVG